MARIVSQTINLQAFSDASAKYITEINSAGIKIHPETYSNNYIQLDGTGLSIYKGSTTYPLATFGGSIIFYEPFSSTQAATIDGNGINIKTGTIASGVTIGASGPTLSTIEANAKQSQIYNIGYNGVLGTHFLGTLTIPNQTAEAEIEIHTGAGQNNNVGQNLTIRVNIKRGYQGATDVTDATCAGITVRYEGSPAIITTAVETNFKIRVTCTNRTEGIFNVYMETDQTYADGWYQVKGRDFTWVHDGTTPATITGTEQTKIASMNPYTTATNYIAYINATDGIKVTYSNASANTTTNYTQISANGISITADSTHYAYVGSGGMSIYSGGIRASFGTDIFLYDGNSHQRAYINSSDGLVLGRWDYVDSRYTQITDDGLFVKKVVSTTDHTQDISMAEFSSSLARIGETSAGHAVIKSDGLHVWTGSESVSTNEVASFGSTIEIGGSGYGVNITDTNFSMVNGTNDIFTIDATGTTRTITQYKVSSATTRVKTTSTSAQTRTRTVSLSPGKTYTISLDGGGTTTYSFTTSSASTTPITLTSNATGTFGLNTVQISFAKVYSNSQIRQVRATIRHTANVIQSNGSYWATFRTFKISYPSTIDVATIHFTGNNNILWAHDTGEGFYMFEGQVVYLSEPISQQLSGVVLAWSSYSGGSSDDNWWVYTFIPKMHTILYEGTEVECGPMSTVELDEVSAKTVAVYDTYIEGCEGNNANGTGSSVSYNNKYWVLRYVYGV